MAYNIGWFSTGRDQAARDLLATVQSGIEQSDIEAGIDFVFCSREPGESAESDLFLKLVASYRIPAFCLSYQKFKAGIAYISEEDKLSLPQWRLEYDRRVMQKLKDFHPKLCVLAGYMLIVGSEMCQHYEMINLHPAAPGGPAGTWQEVIWQLIAADAAETGVMMHLVTPELDKGPPVTYCTFPIKGEPFTKYWEEIGGQPVADIMKTQGEVNRLFRTIREHGLAREFPLIVATIKAFSKSLVRVTPEKKITDAAGRVMPGYDLTAEINGALQI